MQTLKLGATISTGEAQVQLDPKLPVGVYRVQLIVQGSSGISQAATMLIRVLKE